MVSIPEVMFLDGEEFASNALNNCADIATAISSSYDKADEVKFRRQTMTSILGMETS